MANKDSKKLDPNTVVHFWGNYTDDNGEVAKPRRYLLIEERNEYLFFMKFTSQAEDMKREKLGQIMCLIKIEPEFVECLDMISYPVLNQKVRISLADLKITNYRHFHICSLHSNGCLKPKKFTEVYQKFKKSWEDKIDPKVIKRLISLKAGELKSIKGTPLMSRIGINIRRYCSKLRNPCFRCFYFLFIIFFFILLIILTLQ